MYENIKELVSKLGANYNYRTAKENRAILQLIKVEAQELRNAITTKVKIKDYDEKPSKFVESIPEEKLQ